MTSYTGTNGADTINAGSGDDIIDISQGGVDIANGNDGNDQFKLGAQLDASDKLNGGLGNDSVSLVGNYAAGLAFNSTTMLNIEAIK